MRRHMILNIAVLFAANLFAVPLVVVSGLAIWTRFHQQLRPLGPDSSAFALLFVLLAVPSFLFVAYLGRRLLPDPPTLIHLLVVPGGLYAACVVVLVKLVEAYPWHGGGGVLAAFALLFVCALGILVHFSVSHPKRPMSNK